MPLVAEHRHVSSHKPAMEKKLVQTLNLRKSHGLDFFFGVMSFILGLVAFLAVWLKR